MEETKKCPHCGANMKIWQQNLTQGLVEAFIVFSRTLKKIGKNEAHLQTDVNFSKNQYNNFQKLRYFGLVAKVKKADGTHKSGYWLLTRKGLAFLRNELPCNKWVKTFRNAIESASYETVFISDFTNNQSSEYFQKYFNYEIHNGEVK